MRALVLCLRACSYFRRQRGSSKIKEWGSCGPLKEVDLYSVLVPLAPYISIDTPATQIFTGVYICIFPLAEL